MIGLINHVYDEKSPKYKFMIVHDTVHVVPQLCCNYPIHLRQKGSQILTGIILTEKETIAIRQLI